MIKIDGHRLIASAAGMPPVFIYRNSCRTVDEILTKGMPLGSHCDFPYEQREAELASGDTILLMTDGFPESFNEREEIFDYPRVRESFCAVAGRSPEDIIAGLKRDAAAWRNGKPLNDDMTFIVIKVKK